MLRAARCVSRQVILTWRHSTASKWHNHVYVPTAMSCIRALAYVLSMFLRFQLLQQHVRGIFLSVQKHFPTIPGTYLYVANGSHTFALYIFVRCMHISWYFFVYFLKYVCKFRIFLITMLSQVQVIYQRCTPDLDFTCTCAVAVKSGDDVFVVDRCRRSGQANADVVMRTVMFVNGDVTPGTRVFSQSDGADMKVYESRLHKK